MSKPLKDMSTDELASWVNTIDGSAKLKEKTIATLRSNMITGKDLISVKELSDLYDIEIPRLFVVRFFDSIKQKIIEDLKNKPKSRPKPPSFKPSLINGNIQVPVVFGSKNKNLKASLTGTSVIYDLKRCIIDKEGGEIEKLKVICHGKPLNDNDTLNKVGINRLTPVFVTFKVKGGMCDNERIRNPDWDNKEIEATLEPDCLFGYDENDRLRVKMPCEHVFDPNTIYQYVESQLDNHHRLNVSCPIPECKQEWEKDVIISAADLDEKEQLKLVSVLTSRALVKNGQFKTCPGCNGFVERPDTLYMMRVKCESKECRNKSDFCWICANPWKGGGFAVCGNSQCPTAFVNEQLKIENCGTTNAVSCRNDVLVPKIRACPRCLSLVEYEEACKHLECWSCHEWFCFICLSLGYNGGKKWDCQYGDSHTGQCKLAPVQQIK